MEATNNSPYLTGIPLLILIVGVSLATFIQILDYSVANVAVPYIAGGLAVSDNEGTWVITSFAVGNAIALPMTGWLTERFGSSKVMLLSVSLFTFFSFLCGIAFSLDMLVISRFIQGFVAGPLVPLSQSLLLINTPPEKRSLNLSIWFAIVVSAPVIGPILGGWLTYDYSWPWIFFINVPIGVVSVALLWMVLKNHDHERVKKPVDWVGFALLALAIGPLQILFDKGEQLDWFSSPVIRTLLVISAVSVCFLILWELTHKMPLLELRLFKDRSFAVGTIVTSASYMLFFGSIVLTPLWLQEFMGYTALWAGLAIAPMGIIPTLLCPLIPKLNRWFSWKNISITSFSMYVFIFFFFTLFTTEVSFNWIALSRFAFGLPLFIYFTPLVTLSMQNISDKKMSSALGLFHFIRIFAGGAGVSLFVTLWERRSIFHHSNLSSAVNAYNSNSQQIFSKLDRLGFRGKEGLEIVNDLTDKQAALLGLNDAFWLFAWIFFALLFLLFFIGKKKESTLLQ